MLNALELTLANPEQANLQAGFLQVRCRTGVYVQKKDCRPVRSTYPKDGYFQQEDGGRKHGRECLEDDQRSTTTSTPMGSNKSDKDRKVA